MITDAGIRPIAFARWYALHAGPVFPLIPGDKKPLGKLAPHGLLDASTDPDTIGRWWSAVPDAGIGLRTGRASRIVAIDIDPRHAGDDSLAQLEAEHGSLPATVEAITGGGGRHLLFEYPAGDIKIKNRTELDDLPGIDVRADGGYIAVAPSLHPSGNRYRWRPGHNPKERRPAPLPNWLLAMLTAADEGRRTAAAVDGTIPDGRRHETLASLAGSMRRRGISVEGITAALLTENARRCDPPLPETKVRDIARSISRYAPAAETATDPDPEVDAWPDPPAVDVYYGIAGEIVAAFDAFTEADPVAILAQSLVMAGNCIGGGPFYRVEGTQHCANENVVIVGPTSSGKKGTAGDRAREPFKTVDPEWERDNIQGGLSTGEGLIHHVRDARTEKQPIKERGRVTEYQIVEVDAGVSDKRLLVLESEFSRVLKCASREGATLSTTIRQAWDGGTLRVMTKANAARATGAHVSIIGHITGDELLRTLTATDAASGFGNRFLWVVSRRSKMLPEGGDPDPADLAPLYSRLERAIRDARKVGRMTRGPKARDLWREVYPSLTADRAGLLGAMTSRAAPHVVRLSMIYALLAGSATIRLPHLQAALALWDYTERSCRFIFGDSLGDPLADELLRALRAARPDGMTRTDISHHFKRNRSAGEIGRALSVLARQGLAAKTTEQTEGRPVENWSAAP